ncbi:MAG: T9SS type A sorting domain-containing protein, partial [Saprospiraceae bacterium]|nr:T9SS type A sorting domain-containing protein [Saprospiraceae bacterium]
MKTKITLLFSLVLWAILSTGQTLSPSVVALAGGYEKTPGGLTVSWTLGEPAVDPIRSTSVQLTQGFQQPNLKVSTGFTDPAFAYGLITYPNPASTELIMETDYEETLDFRMVDISGKIIQEGKWSNKNVIDVSFLSQGIYVIYFTNDGRMVKSELIN